MVLLDLNMPAMCGLAVLQVFVDKPHSPHLFDRGPVDLGRHRRIDACYRAGCNLFLTKPVQYAVFTQLVQQLGALLKVAHFPSGAATTCSVYLYGNDMDSSDNRVNLQVENVGIGPARILDFGVYVDGKPQKTWRAAVEALLGPRDGIRLSQSTINGRTIPAERRITIFSLESMEHAAELAAALPRLEMQACYCSIFDECWTAEYDALGITEPVDTCVRSDASFQQ